MRRETDVMGRARGATVLFAHRAAELVRAGRVAEEDLPGAHGQTKQKKERDDTSGLDTESMSGNPASQAVRQVGWYFKQFAKPRPHHNKGKKRKKKTTEMRMASAAVDV